MFFSFPLQTYSSHSSITIAKRPRAESYVGNWSSSKSYHADLYMRNLQKEVGCVRLQCGVQELLVCAFEVRHVHQYFFRGGGICISRLAELEHLESVTHIYDFIPFTSNIILPTIYKQLESLHEIEWPSQYEFSSEFTRSQTRSLH
jgi:hypothetical protein